MSNKNTKEAKEALVWYFRLAAAGKYNFDSDNQVEIERIVDDIIAAAVAAAVAEMKAASGVGDGSHRDDQN